MGAVRVRSGFQTEEAVIRRLCRALTFSNVCSFLALTVALGTGGAYAANTIGSADIIDESVRSVDIKNAQIASADLAVDAVSGNRIKNGGVATGKLAINSVGAANVIDNTLTGADIANGTLTGADITDGAITRAKNAAPEIWHYVGDPGEPAFENGWGNYGSDPNPVNDPWQHAAFMVDNQGMVHVRGMIASGVLGQPAFTLPTAYCPWYFHAFPVLSNNSLGRLNVYSSDCAVTPAVGSNEWVNLDGVSYLEANLENRVRPAPPVQAASARGPRNAGG